MERLVAEDVTVNQVPDHVDPSLVVDFDYLSPPGFDGRDIFRSFARLHQGPDLVWTPHHGGHWIATRADDTKWIQESWDIFSVSEKSVPRGSMPYMPPLSCDPPDHARFRAVLNPYFAKRRIEGGYEAKAREVITGLIEKIRPKGTCEFVSEFGYIAPISIFFELVDLPFERRDEFLSWGRQFGSRDLSEKIAAQLAISGYLGDLLEERLEKPGADVFTGISQWRDNPRYNGREEIAGMAQLVFLGGQDTVASLMSFTMWRLAERPDLQQRLKDDPAVIPAAVEELLRRHGLSLTSRLIMRDVDHKGAQLRKGDMILVVDPLSSVDPRVYDDPFTVDFDRQYVTHNNLGNGPHKCVGEHLARMELRVLLEEWSRHMPIVEIDPDAPEPLSHAGAVIGVEHLHLRWPGR